MLIPPDSGVTLSNEVSVLEVTAQCHCSSRGVDDQVTLGFSITSRFLVEFNLCSWWHSDMTAKGKQQLAPVSLLRVMSPGFTGYFSSGMCSHKTTQDKVMTFQLFQQKAAFVLSAAPSSLTKIPQPSFSPCWIYTLTCFLSSGFEVTHYTGEVLKMFAGRATADSHVAFSGWLKK